MWQMSQRDGDPKILHHAACMKSSTTAARHQWRLSAGEHASLRNGRECFGATTKSGGSSLSRLLQSRSRAMSARKSDERLTSPLHDLPFATCGLAQPIRCHSQISNPTLERPNTQRFLSIAADSITVLFLLTDHPIDARFCQRLGWLIGRDCEYLLTHGLHVATEWKLALESAINAWIELLSTVNFFDVVLSTGFWYRDGWRRTGRPMTSKQPQSTLVRLAVVP
ncbi:hypothetical protein CC80DRAFT_261581 [Byssothecium circinans]|uniref:Uncharacterized protein n=1 Tax=Byssothecium circinans TaxID=147558 RepID=A0A6A5U9G4_9PLEO|nr:hypothetical protein CC80DRAFT_261581 [Byssothecium circinans]